MILVVGGLAQDKLLYAGKNLGVTSFDDGRIGDTDCIYNLQNCLIDADYDEFICKLDEYISAHPDCVIICNEVGGGLVPVKKQDREYRENVGRVCCMLAKRADEVYRVICGIGSRIK